MSHRFLRSLMHIRRRRRIQHHDVSVTGRRIKAAAYMSMARAAIRNPKRRLWARALLLKMRQRRRSRTKSSSDDEMKRKLLGELVPGGECMEFCTLLEEAADYIKYLTAQIRVMQAVADALTDV
ncbi:unnamed protein product [Rhodiola kirilowii]